MYIICDNNKCTGCSACAQICSRTAISMYVADDGFLRPQIAKNKCVDCGMCVNICPANTSVHKFHPQKVYLAWNNKLPDRLNSSSGGVFPAIADKILSEGGVVFGASYDYNMNVHHLCIESKNNLKKLQGSKYVQSTIGDTYKQVKFFLSKNRKVYFVGTPCQVAGLKAFLRKDHSNLFTSDLICHGCPSNDLFQKQILNLQNKYSKRIENIEFRNKDRFGQGYDIKVIFENGTYIYKNAELMPYFYGFWKNLTLRRCCYQCQYTTPERVSDITLADYWSVKKKHKGIKTAKGTSLVICNTSKGLDVINSCNLTLFDDTIENAIEIQGHLSHSVSPPESYESFVKNYSNITWEQIKRNYLDPDIKYIIKMRIRNFLKIISLYKRWK